MSENIELKESNKKKKSFYFKYFKFVLSWVEVFEIEKEK
jgi:hypothetical protein